MVRQRQGDDTMEHDGTHSQKLPDTSIQLEYAWNPDKRLLTTCEPRNQLMKYWDRHLDAMEITMQQPCSNFQYPYGATISINFSHQRSLFRILASQPFFVGGSRKLRYHSNSTPISM